MTSIDLKKVHKDLYNPRKDDPALVEVPDFSYLMADGEGDPNGNPRFQEAVGMLYGISYALKFRLKKDGRNYTVMPLEGLFCADDPSAFMEDRRREWKWTLMILQPVEVDRGMLEEAAAAFSNKKKLAGPPAIRLETLSEGLCAQILHLGPYSKEGPTIASLHRFMEENGYGFGGTHHEIYLSNPERVAPEKMRTVIRQPLRWLKKGAKR